MLVDSIKAERLGPLVACLDARDAASFGVAAAVQCSVETIDPLAGDDWDAALEQTSSTPTVFHSSAWARVLHETYGHDPHYLCVRRRNRILALVPLMEVDSGITGRRGVAVPFADTCAPLWVSAPDHATLAHAMAFYSRWHHWKHLEIRGGIELPVLSNVGRTYQNHELDLLEGGPSLWSRMAPATRRAIRKAERSDLKVSVDQSESSIRDYYRLHARTRRRFGLPPQPLKFFLNLHRHLIQQDRGVIVIASKHHGPVAGSIFLFTGGQAVYKFGASDERFWDARPNQLVMWHGILELEQRGVSTLGFGRTAVGNEGLAHFKSSFGAKARPLIYHRYRPDHGWHSDSCSSPSEERRVWLRSTPIFLNRLVGACIYPHLD